MTNGESFTNFKVIITKCHRYYKVRQNVLQSVTDITKCEKKLLQTVTDVTKCDKKLIQSATSDSMDLHCTKNEVFH